jgi:hypothetical protein
LRFATILSGDPPPLLTDKRKLGHNKTVRRSRSPFAVGCLRFAEQGSGINPHHSGIDPARLVDVRADPPNGRRPTVNGELRTANGELRSLLRGKTLGKLIPQELRDIASQNLVTVGTEMDLIVLEKGDVQLFIRAKQIGI